MEIAMFASRQKFDAIAFGKVVLLCARIIQR
jgi:hypothetical protein